MIDIHTHIGRLRFGQKHVTPGGLIKMMNRYRIDIAVVMSVENPEELDY